MRRHFLLIAFLVVVASMLASSGSPAGQAAVQGETQAPTYMNAEVVRTDPSASTITIRSESGETVLQVEGAARAALPDLRESDKVIVTYRVVDDAAGERRVVVQLRPASPSSGEPGPAPRAAAVAVPPARTIETPAPAATVAVRTTPTAPPTAGGVVQTGAGPVAVTASQLDALRLSAATDFEVTIAGLATQANAVDGLWLGFQESCLAEPPPTNRSRGWFQLLDGTVPEPGQDGCRQQYEEIIRRGERLREAVKLAEDTARKAEVVPGVLRETLERHRLDI
jgi:hypothetical protein